MRRSSPSNSRAFLARTAGWTLSGVHSNARDLTRFGQAVLDRDGLGLPDSFLAEMFTGTDENPSHGLLWWLYGGRRAVVIGQRPGEDPDPRKMFGGVHLDRSIAPSAPDDTVAGHGVLDQRLYVVPSRGLVIAIVTDAEHFVGGPEPFDEGFWNCFAT